jgi:hypothetical protein
MSQQVLSSQHFARGKNLASLGNGMSRFRSTKGQLSEVLRRAAHGSQPCRHCLSTKPVGNVGNVAVLPPVSRRPHADPYVWHYRVYGFCRGRGETHRKAHPDKNALDVNTECYGLQDDDSDARQPIVLAPAQPQGPPVATRVAAKALQTIQLSRALL